MKFEVGVDVWRPPSLKSPSVGERLWKPAVYRAGATVDADRPPGERNRSSDTDSRLVAPRPDC
jgi:hypothetical protein